MGSYIINKEESARFNILKYISIILVVYIHSYATHMNFSDGTSNLTLPWWLFSVEKFISHVIANCAVPMFFLISSILLFKAERNYKKTMIGKVKTLLIPYLFWNSFWIIVFILLQCFPFTGHFFSEDSTPILQSSISEWLALYGISLTVRYPQDYPLWFMRDLMVVTLFFPIIGKIASKFPTTLLIISAALLLAPISFLFKQALLWFCIGACIVNLQIHMTIFDNIALWKFTLVYIPCAFITLLIQHHITNTLFSFIGIIYWVRVSKSIFDFVKARSVFAKLSEWTFIIYAAHELTLTSLKKVCIKLLPVQPIWLLAEYLILPIVVIAGCSIVGAVCKKVAPKLYSIITGAR